MKLIMSWVFRPVLARLSLTVFCLLFQGVAGAGETVSLLPIPLHVQYVEGEYVVPDTVNIKVPDDSNLKASADWFAGLITQGNRREVRVSAGTTEGAAIRVERISQDELQAQFEEAKLVPVTGLTEAYSLQIKPNGVLIQASDNAGIFYGLSTLWQLLNQHPGPNGKLP